MDHFGDALVGGGDGGEAFLGQDDGLDAVDLGGRAGQAAPLEIAALMSSRSHCSISEAGLAQGLDPIGGFGLLLGVVGLGKILGDLIGDFAAAAGAA